VLIFSIFDYGTYALLPILKIGEIIPVNGSYNEGGRIKFPAVELPRPFSKLTPPPYAVGNPFF